MSDQNENKIRDRAYHLWREHGCAEGQDLDFWLQAEREILGDAATGIAPGAKARAPRPAAPAAAAQAVAGKPKAPAKPRAPAKPKSPLM